jgi:predicted TPR repeat methyltransferase
LSAALRDRGAVLTGIDASAGMLALAGRRLGDEVPRHVVDLSDRLPFADSAFADVVAMTDAFTAAGFRLAGISEPQPDPAARELFPDGFHDLSTKPAFLFFVVEVPPSAAGSDDQP